MPFLNAAERLSWCEEVLKDYEIRIENHPQIVPGTNDWLRLAESYRGLVLNYREWLDYRDAEVERVVLLTSMFKAQRIVQMIAGLLPFSWSPDGHRVRALMKRDMGHYPRCSDGQCVRCMQPVNSLEMLCLDCETIAQYCPEQTWLWEAVLDAHHELLKGPLCVSCGEHTYHNHNVCMDCIDKVG